MPDNTIMRVLLELLLVVLLKQLCGVLRAVTYVSWWRCSNI